MLLKVYCDNKDTSRSGLLERLTDPQHTRHCYAIMALWFSSMMIDSWWNIGPAHPAAAMCGCSLIHNLPLPCQKIVIIIVVAAILSILPMIFGCGIHLTEIYVDGTDRMSLLGCELASHQMGFPIK